MKKSELKKLIKECVKEILCKESHWEEPEEKYYSNLVSWEKDNVDAVSGKYKGEPLNNYGFPYKVGSVVPKEVGFRRLAMGNWNDAKKAKNNNLKLGRPLGMSESMTTRTELDTGIMKAVNLENEFDGKKWPKHNAKISKEEMEEAKTVAHKIWQPVYLTTFHSTSLDGKHKFFEIRLHSATGDRHWMYKDEHGKWFYSKGTGVESKFVPADEYLKEMSTTGGVAGYNTPFAFSKKSTGSKKAMDATKKAGYTPVKKNW